MSKTVCHITTIHPSEDTRIKQKECLTLAEEGYDVTLISGRPDPNTPSGPVRLIGVEYKGGGPAWRALNAWRIYRRALALGANAYHFHDPDFLPFAYLLALRGKRVIYDVHEDVPTQIMYKTYLPRWLRMVLSQVVLLIERFVCRQFAAVMCATDYIRDRFLAYNSNTITLRNFPKLSEFPSTPSSYEGRDYQGCYVGAISDHRSIRQMIRSCDSAKVRLRLAGNFWPSLLEAECRAMPEWKAVDYDGVASRPEVAEFTSSSLFGMVIYQPLRNYVEALPVKMFEYMAAGMPVIVSDFPVTREILERHQCGYSVDPEDETQLAAAIAKVLADPEEARAMAERGRRAVETDYNWDAEKKRLSDAYAALLAQV